MAHKVDIHVGNKIRQQRWVKGMTQQQLASAVGIKFQQIQKYETGMNRVSASRLWDISQTLDVSIDYFFGGIDETEIPEGTHHDLIESKEVANLVRYYRDIPENQRRKLFEMAQTLAAK